MNQTAELPIVVILNRGSGSQGRAAVRAQIESVLAACSRAFSLREARGAKELRALVRRAVQDAQREPCIVAAAGGDGTINAVAAGLLGTGVPLGVIPAGTFNFVARELGIPLDPAKATRALLEGQLAYVSVGMVNGHPFFNNASFGLYRRLLEEREQAKRRFGRTRAVALLAALATLLRRHRSYDVELELDGRTERRRTPVLFIGFNALQLAKLAPALGVCAEQDRLAVLALQPMGRLALLGLALRGSLRGLAGESGLYSSCAARLEVRLLGARRMRVAVDGELIDCELPLRFAVQRDALSVVVPRKPEARE